jgi:hypothetical protein
MEPSIKSAHCASCGLHANQHAVLHAAINTHVSFHTKSTLNFALKTHTHTHTHTHARTHTHHHFFSNVQGHGSWGSVCTENLGPKMMQTSKCLLQGSPSPLAAKVALPFCCHLGKKLFSIGFSRTHEGISALNCKRILCNYALFAVKYVKAIAKSS